VLNLLNKSVTDFAAGPHHLQCGPKSKPLPNYQKSY